MKKFVASSIIALTLLSAAAFAQTPDGTFAVRVPSKNPFVATVTLEKGKVVGFTMERNEAILRESQVTGSKVVITADFLGSCGKGSSGQMNFDITNDTLVFRQWKGRCESKKANFSVRRKIRTTKQ